MSIAEPTYYAHWRDVPKADWRWPNFSPQEIACRGTGRVLVNPEALDRLQALRNALGKPLILNSAYRSPEHNKRVGGAKHSQHLNGVAFDVHMGNHDPARFEAAARNAGFTGFGFYPPKPDGRHNFMHIDTGPAREWGKRWGGPVFAREPDAGLTVAMSKNAPPAAAGAGLTAAAAVAPTALEKAQELPFTSLSDPVQIAVIVAGVATVAGLGWLAVKRGWI